MCNNEQNVVVCWCSGLYSYHFFFFFFCTFKCLSTQNKHFFTPPPPTHTHTHTLRNPNAFCDWLFFFLFRKVSFVGSIMKLATFWVTLRQKRACDGVLKYCFCRQLTMFWHRAFVCHFSMSWIIQTLDLRRLLLHGMENVPRYFIFLST